MRCLHICNDFLGSKVHENLYKHLDKLNVEQTVFYPLRESKLKQLKNYKKGFDFEILTSNPLKKYHRVLFRCKVKYLYNALSPNINKNSFDIVHATTLFSDGAIALKIKKKFNIPFIVAVRSTDIDAFLKYRPDLIFLAKEILEQSSQIIFISNALKERFLNHPLIKKNKHKLNHKCLVINNGIDPYWLENRTEKREIEPTKILYVGSLVKRKNATKLIHSVLNLRKSGLQCELTIVGEGGSFQKEVEQLASANYPIINYIGAVKDKTKLKEIYNNHHIFALPSNIETFGLVYIEALSQGIPVLYAKNQGIDGTFREMVGEAIDFNNENGIETGLKKLVENYNSYELEKIDFTRFSWSDIAKTYLNLYKA